jgi:DNA polymerase III psi subunit
MPINHLKKSDEAIPKDEGPVKKEVLVINKPVLILAKNITEPQQIFLTKILGSVNISFENAEIIDVDKTNDFIISKNCKKILFFGPEANNLKVSTPNKYLPFKSEPFNYLLSDNLSTLELNINDEKRKLWNALKEFVNI